MKAPEHTKATAVMDDVLRRMLGMPPDPHKPKEAKRKPMSKPKPKQPKKKPA